MTMPGFTLPPPPPRPPADAATTGGAAMYPPGFQYELHIRDRTLHKLQLENVRLQVQLEQAGRDVKTAMEAMMVALRSGGDARKDADSRGRAENDGRHTAASVGMRGFEPEFMRTSELRGWTPSKSGGADIAPVDRSRRTEESLLDLRSYDDEKLTCGDWGPTRRPMGKDGWETPPPLPILSPLNNQPQGDVADPFVSERIGRDVDQTWDASSQSNEPRFTPLIDLPVNESRKTEDEARTRWPTNIEKAADGIFKDAARKIDFAVPQAERHGHGKAAESKQEGPECPRTRDQLATQGHLNEQQYDTPMPRDEKIFGETIPGCSHRTVANSSDDPTKSSGNTQTNRESTDSDPPYYCKPSRGPRFQSYGVRRSGSPRPVTRRAYRSDDDELPPLYGRYGIAYVPAEGEKNLYRTVVIYNLSPQTDVADILERARDAPVVSIKLLPTMGMKFRKSNGSTGVLTSMTALMTFFLETSAEQFVFDVQSEPLSLRGRVAVAKLLDKPTYPSHLDANTFQRAPGRVFSRSIKFPQPGLVPADKFDGVLSWRSHGFRTPGWIVSKTVKKVRGGSNMVTVEFASVDTARWAFKRIDEDRSFETCRPQWVYDHYNDGDENGRALLKTRDDEGSSEGEVLVGLGSWAATDAGTLDITAQTSSAYALDREQTPAGYDLDVEPASGI